MNDKNRFGLKNQDIARIVETISKTISVERIIIFGSRAIGTFKEGSDIDLALMGEELTYTDVRRIKIELYELNLPYQFDLLVYHNITDQAVRDHIDSCGLDFAATV